MVQFMKLINFNEINYHFKIIFQLIFSIYVEIKL